MIVAVFVVAWSQENPPLYRPLIQDLRLVDSVKISDTLDQQKIHYYADVKNHMLYVEQEQSELARISLAKIGIVIEYPHITKYNDLSEAYDALLQQSIQSAKPVNVWHEPWFLKLVKLIVGGLIIIVIILSIVRPILQEIIGESDEN